MLLPKSLDGYAVLIAFQNVLVIDRKVGIATLFF